MNIPELPTGEVKAMARNVLQTYCTSGADINTVTDAEITQLAVQVASSFPVTDIPKLADTKSEVYQTYAKQLGAKVCELATSRSTKKAGFSLANLPSWLKWTAIGVGALILYKVIK